MCRVISLSKLDDKTKAFVESFGGSGMVRVTGEETVQKEVEQEEQAAWEQFVERERSTAEGGMW